MITIKEVEHIATLARLTLTDEEKKLYAEQLSEILEYFSQLESIDTANVEPMSHPIDSTNVMRDDHIESPQGHEKMLENAPDKEGPYFRVPKIGS